MSMVCCVFIGSPAHTRMDLFHNAMYCCFVLCALCLLVTESQALTTKAVSAFESSTAPKSLLVDEKKFAAPASFATNIQKAAITIRETKIITGHRRIVLQSIFALSSSALLISSSPAMAFVGGNNGDTSLSKFRRLQNYTYSKNWTGTGLSLLSMAKAASIAAACDDESSYYVMGKWPDPILRRPAMPCKDFAGEYYSKAKDLKQIAFALRRTARRNGAVGLAAQQCGIDVSMIFLDNTQSNKKEKKYPSSPDTINQGGLFLVNPRIVRRSQEENMRVWEEECLVLPPTFRATVLRDAQVMVEYETLAGKTQTVSLEGELARALQHELDHDRGILITDHVGLEELESDTMRLIERQGHEQRQALAYSRFVAKAHSFTG